MEYQTVFALAMMEYAVGVSKFGKNPKTLLVHQYQFDMMKGKSGLEKLEILKFPHFSHFWLSQAIRKTVEAKIVQNSIFQKKYSANNLTIIYKTF